MKKHFKEKPAKLLSIQIVTVALACLAVASAPNTFRVVPAPDGGYPGGNTAEGQNALSSLTTGTYNTAVGSFSLTTNAEGNFNTGIGAGTLLANTADRNTAIGAGALLSKTTRLMARLRSVPTPPASSTRPSL